jgi:Flp pilus assembly protein TadG
LHAPFSPRLLQRVSKLLSPLPNGSAVLVEFAILFPIFVLLIVGGIDVGLSMISADRLQFATEAAARCGAIPRPPCPDANATKIYAEAAAALPGATFNVASAACGTQVDATYSYTSFILPNIPLSASSCYP